MVRPPKKQAAGLVVDLLTGAADRASNPFAPDRPFAPREHDVL